MASSRGSQTTQAFVAPPSRPQSRSTVGPSFRSPNASLRSRALVSPIDASLALWGEGRRQRAAELEEELSQRDAEQQGQQQQTRGSAGSAEAAGDREHGERVGSSRSRTLAPEESPIATPAGKAAAAPKQRHTEGSRPTATRGGAGGPDATAPAAPPPAPARVGAGKAADRAVDNNPAPGPSSRAVGGVRSSRAPLSPTTPLEERLGRWGAGWRPPALRELPRGGAGFFSEWSHLGQPERFELVKSVNRSVAANGDALSDAELEWAVLCLEEAEERMAALDFSTAAGVLERVLGRHASECLAG